MQFKIEKDIPIPTRATNQIYPFSDMEVGDSVFVDGEQGQKAMASAHSYGHAKGRKFVSRKEGTGVRIWRTK